MQKFEILEWNIVNPSRNEWSCEDMKADSLSHLVQKVVNHVYLQKSCISVSPVLRGSERKVVEEVQETSPKQKVLKLESDRESISSLNELEC